MVVKHEQDRHVVVPRSDILERVGELVRGCVDRVRVSGDRGLARDEDRFHVQIVDDVPFSWVRVGAGYRYEREVSHYYFDRHVRPDDGAIGGRRNDAYGWRLLSGGQAGSGKRHECGQQ